MIASSSKKKKGPTFLLGPKLGALTEGLDLLFKKKKKNKTKQTKQNKKTPELRRSTPAREDARSSPLNPGIHSSSHLLQLYFTDLSLTCCACFAYQLERMKTVRQIIT
jgi:hypothetical protein